MPFGENTIGTLYTTIDGKMVELGKATLTEVETYLEESKYEWVRVVRCKDCKRRHDFDCPMFFEESVEWEEDGYIERDDVIHDYTEDDDFCSRAERKDT